ncbi:TolC family protein [Haliea sp. E17]|uniref:TolC family protein n=1 Tax=Haliea sp. E17 TaxID=3401576 RepID=UPI003AB099B3
MPLSTRLLCALFTALLAPVTHAAGASSARDLALNEVVDVMLSRPTAARAEAPFSASGWLAGLPSLDASYLQSEERLGTDETEIGLNLPIKSPFLYWQDKRLRELDSALHSAAVERRRLYFSGLLREAVWTARIAGDHAQQAGKMIALLEQLQRREQDLFEARGSSRYALLLIEQELADARIVQEDQQAEAQRWLARYRSLTGLGSLPVDIDEPAAPAGEAWQTHPALQLLELEREQRQALVAAGSSRGTPWNLRIGAKRVESPEFDETQYGVAVELPLGFTGTDRQSSSSEWQSLEREFTRNRDELSQELARSWQNLQIQAQHLQRRQQLLDAAASISGQLYSEAEALSQLNELGSEIRIKRLIGELERQAEASTNQLLIGQNRAMSRQAAGIPL